MASLTKSCIEKKKRATALIDGGTKTKRPTLGRMFDTLNKRCKLSEFTNYISNTSNLRERVVVTQQNVILTQNVIRIAAKCNTNAKCNNIDAKCNKIFNAE